MEMLQDLRLEHPAINQLMTPERQDELIAFARRNGYVITDRGHPVGSVGVPIADGGRLIGALSCMFIKAGFSRQRVLADILPELRGGAAEIERLYRLAAQAKPDLS